MPSENESQHDIIITSWFLSLWVAILTTPQWSGYLEKASRPSHAKANNLLTAKYV